MMPEVINFYKTKDPYGFFSNFSRHPIELGGKTWPTTEHYFQAMKFESTDPVHAEEIRLADTPAKAAKMGRMRSKPLRKDWESVKDETMRRAVIAKFFQHNDIGQDLVNTGDAELVEHTKNDRYWGDGGDGTGKNMLGKILMEVREQLNA
jgi:ribA/ribD-fused uncharacterized protein